MNTDELRKGLAGYLGRDPETIGHERGERGSYTWTLLGGGCAEGWGAVLWLADNAPPGTSHGVPRAGGSADATHCHICGLRLKVVEQRKRGADVWRKTRCPSGTCPNGKRWQASIRRVEKPGRAKPDPLTDRPVRRPVQSADELNFGPHQKNSEPARAKSQSTFRIRDYLAKHGEGGIGIQVDALRVGQRWRNPEDTETRVVASHRHWLRPHLHVGNGVTHADPGDCVADGWRCIEDVQEVPTANAKSEPRPHPLWEGYQGIRIDGLRVVSIQPNGKRLTGRLEHRSQEPGTPAELWAWCVICDGERGPRYFYLDTPEQTRDLRSHWRPLKPVKVERGQRWRQPWHGRFVKSMTVVRLARGADGTADVNFGDKGWTSERDMLTSDNWQYILEKDDNGEET